jgi:hypothetical protein
MMNGMSLGDIIDEINDQTMVYMDQKDDIVEIKSSNDWVFLANDRDEPWKDLLTRNVGDNIHLMNKRSIDRHYAEILEKLNA